VSDDRLSSAFLATDNTVRVVHEQSNPLWIVQNSKRVIKA